MKFDDIFQVQIVSKDTSPFNALHGIINEIQYVHELQHALRLCGIEKEIQL